MRARGRWAAVASRAPVSTGRLRAGVCAALLTALGGCSGEDEGPLPAGGQAGAVVGGGGSGAAGGSPSSTAGGSAGSGGGLAGGEPTGPCPSDMLLAGETCVDRYEAPNVAGEPPLAMRTAYDGADWCVALDKRLCTDVEWTRACQGPTGATYPYGNEHVEHRCNDDQTWIAPDWDALATWPSEEAVAEAERLYQADPSGERSACISAEGALDLTGNVAEWVVRTIPNANNHDHVLKGCYWAGCYGGTLPNCTFVNPAHESGYRTYEAGFRCCRDPEPR